MDSKNEEMAPIARSSHQVTFLVTLYLGFLISIIYFLSQKNDIVDHVYPSNSRTNGTPHINTISTNTTIETHTAEPKPRTYPNIVFILTDDQVNLTNKITNISDGSVFPSTKERCS